MRARILHLLPALLSIETGVLLLIFFFRKWGYFNLTFDGFLSLLQFRSASGFDFATGWDDRAYGGSYPDWKAIYSLFYLPIAGILLTSAGMLYARGIVTHQRVYKTWIISGLFGIFAILVQHLEAQQQLASYSRNFNGSFHLTYDNNRMFSIAILVSLILCGFFAYYVTLFRSKALVRHEIIPLLPSYPPEEVIGHDRPHHSQRQHPHPESGPTPGDCTRYQ